MGLSFSALAGNRDHPSHPEPTWRYRDPPWNVCVPAGVSILSVCFLKQTCTCCVGLFVCVSSFVSEAQSSLSLDPSEFILISLSFGC